MKNENMKDVHDKIDWHRVEQKSAIEAARDWFLFIDKLPPKKYSQVCGDARCKGIEGCPNPDHDALVSWFNNAKRNAPADDSSRWWEEGTKLSIKERALLLVFRALNNIVAALIRWNNRIAKKLIESNVVVLEQKPLTFCSKDLIDFATRDNAPYGVEKQVYVRTRDKISNKSNLIPL
jgi:hypothetical protein